MPSKNRRMMLTLPPELAAVLDDFRATTGTAPSSFVVEMLMEAIPAIQAICDATRALSTDQEHAMTIMNAVLSDVLHQGTAAQMDMYEKKSIRKARSDHVRKSKP